MIGVQQHDEGVGEIRRLRVGKEHRRKGIGSALVQALDIATAAPPAPVAAERQGWFSKLSAGLRKTGSSLSQAFRHR